MKNNIIEFDIELSKKGYPTAWEEGGKRYSDTGKAIIIGDSKAMKKKPVFIKRHGHRACLNHALFFLNKGDIIVRGTLTYYDKYSMKIEEEWRGKTEVIIEICRVIDFDKENLKAHAEVLDKFEKGVWSGTAHEDRYFGIMAEVATRKAKYYHCQIPLYYKWWDKNYSREDFIELCCKHRYQFPEEVYLEPEFNLCLDDVEEALNRTKYTTIYADMIRLLSKDKWNKYLAKWYELAKEIDTTERWQGYYNTRKAAEDVYEGFRKHILSQGFKSPEELFASEGCEIVTDSSKYIERKEAYLKDAEFLDRSW